MEWTGYAPDNLVPTVVYFASVLLATLLAWRIKLERAPDAPQSPRRRGGGSR